jgi:methyl halide transferase
VDVRHAVIDTAAGSARVVVSDGEGTREVALLGVAAARVVAAAVAALGAHSRLEIDWLARTVAIDREAAGPMSAWPSLTGLARAIVDEVRVRVRTSDEPRDAEAWSKLYDVGGDGWELGRAAPPLVRWVAEHPRPGRRTLVPGCGRGHEVRAFAAAGDVVTGLDFSEAALVRAKEIPATGAIEWRLGDVFRLAEQPDRWDLVVEHTCFCAIPVERRDDYVDAIADVLVPGGHLVGLFWTHDRPGGPPCAVTPVSLEAHLERRFVIETLAIAADSVATRQGEETLVVARVAPAG